jgi:hypothetical protein
MSQLSEIIENHQRNESLCNPYAAIDTKYRKNDDKKNNTQKPYTVFAVAIADILGNAKVRHEPGFSNNSHPEKGLENGKCLKFCSTN